MSAFNGTKFLENVVKPKVDGVRDSRVINNKLNESTLTATEEIGTSKSATSLAAVTARNKGTVKRQHAVENKSAHAKRKHHDAGERHHQHGRDVDPEYSEYFQFGDPPETEDIIEALLDIKMSALGDLVVRERIAKLPPGISDMSCLTKLEDEAAARALFKQLNEAAELLNKFNVCLAAKMAERRKLAAKLRVFQAAQNERLAQAELIFEEQKTQLNKVMAVQRKMRERFSHLGDCATMRTHGLP